MHDIITWYHDNKRDLPWRNTKNPYKIWLSEIILQQTRVAQGLNYYLKFVNSYPTIKDLALAHIDEVLLLWQGLGYYSRARNLHQTAINISKKYNGKFPEEYSELIKFKGIGDYTAAAIASIAFSKPEAVVDGNVFRVFARYFADPTPIDSTVGKKVFKILATKSLDVSVPGEHNQAVMELGAMVCLPVNPICPECPLKSSCLAFINGSQALYPVKSKTIKQRSRYFYYFIFEVDRQFYISQRINKDIWQGLFQFPCIEKEKTVSKNNLLPEAESFLSSKNAKVIIKHISHEFKHVLSHQLIRGRFIHISLNNDELSPLYKLVPIKSLNEYAMPRLITRYLEENPQYFSDSNL